MPFSSASSNSKSISADGLSIYNFMPASPSSSVFSQSHTKGGAGDTKYRGTVRDRDRDEHDYSVAGGVDEWGFVRKNVQALFDGDQLRTPVEDMNKYVYNHIRRCVERKRPDSLLADVNDILAAGMLSLDPTLQHYPDMRLVPRLVELWQFVLTQILPYFEAVFLPLQQEFRGVGAVMEPRQAREFWSDVLEKEGCSVGATIIATAEDGDGGGRGVGSGGTIGGGGGGGGWAAALGGPDPARILDTRRMALISFRDNVVLPLYKKLQGMLDG